MQREDKPTMETGLERIAAKARSEPKLRFTSLAHHITRERVWTNLCQIPKRSAPGVDGQTVTVAKETFGEWVEPVLRSVHRQGYRAPDIRRVYIPKPGKREKRPLGVPGVNDRALQRSIDDRLGARLVKFRVQRRWPNQARAFVMLDLKHIRRGCLAGVAHDEVTNIDYAPFHYETRRNADTERPRAPAGATYPSVTRFGRMW